MKQSLYSIIVALALLSSTAAWGMEKSPASTDHDREIAAALSVTVLREPAVLQRTGGARIISLKRKALEQEAQESKRKEEKEQPPLKKAKTAKQAALEALVENPAVQKLLQGILNFGDQKEQADMIECLQEEQEQFKLGVEREMAEAAEADRKAKLAALTPEQIQAELHQRILAGHAKFIKKHGAEQTQHDLVFQILSKKKDNGIAYVLTHVRSLLHNPQAKIGKGTHSFINRQIKEHIAFIKKYADNPDRILHSDEEQIFYRQLAYYKALYAIATTCYANICELPAATYAPASLKSFTPLSSTQVAATVTATAKAETSEAPAAAAPAAQTLAAAAPLSSPRASSSNESGEDEGDDEVASTQELDDDGLEII